MNKETILNDIFFTAPSRFCKGKADNNFRCSLGFDIGYRCWTISIEGKSCQVFEGLKSCDAVIRTGSDEMIGIATNSADPVALFLSKRLTVEGNIEAALQAISLFEGYTSKEVTIKDPSWVVDTLGNYFRVNEDGHFFIEGLDCVDLAEQFGTPLFVTSEGQLRENIRHMKKVFTSAYVHNDVNVMWAIKSNTMLAFRRIMNEEGAGGDCFTQGEMYATFKTGSNPEMLLLNGSNRDEDTFRLAIDIGMRITLDHMDDLFMVEKLARQSRARVKTLIRVKCELKNLKDVKSTFVPGATIPLEVLHYKFGVTYDEAIEIAQMALQFPHIEIEGIHCHIGRDLHLPEHWRMYAYDMVKLCTRFRDDTGITPSILDIGGGFAEKRDPSGHDLMNMAAPIEEYAYAVTQGIEEGCMQFNFPFPKLWVEPGRHLIGSTTVMISRVGTVKRTPGVATWVHVDASCNFLPSVERHNGMSYHIFVGTRARAKSVEIADIVGPNCSGDLIQPRRRLPHVERGDLLIFLDVGAYNAVAANQFNSIPRPSSVLVSGNKADIICERETVLDVFSHQRIPARLNDMCMGTADLPAKYSVMKHNKEIKYKSGNSD